MPRPNAERRNDGSYKITSKPENFCTRCGENFASLSAFTKHFASKPSELTICYGPSEFLDLGLEERDNGNWGFPIDPEKTYTRKAS